MQPVSSDAVDLAQTDERTIIDLAGRGLSPLLVLGRYRYLRAHEPVANRHHTLLVLAVPVRGRFDFDLDEAPHQVDPGQAIRIPPGVTYRTGATAEPRGSLMWLIAHAAPDAGEEALERAIGQLAEAAEPLTFTAPHSLVHTLERAFTLASEPRDWITDALLLQTITTSVLELTRALTFTEAAHATWSRHQIEAVLHWIEEHLHDSASPTELAAVAGLSTSQFYAAFRNVTGTSPKDYVLRRKTEHARDWLHNDPTVTVATVAHTLGFSTSQQFATVFRRYHGTSPTAHRHHHGHDEPTGD